MSIVEKLVETNDPHYNLLKCVEELTELNEVLIKRLVKGGSPKDPSDASIIEEIGDVKIRIMVLEKIFGEEKVQARVDYKLGKFESYIEEGKYLGRI